MRGPEGVLGVPAACRTALALRAPSQQPGKAAATCGGLARNAVPGECSLAGYWWLLGLGGPCQLGSHMLQVFSSPLLHGIPGCLTEHVWLERLILRLPGSQGKPLWGPRAGKDQGCPGAGWYCRAWLAPVPAQPQPAESPLAAEGSWVLPCQATRCAGWPRHHKLGREGVCVLGGGGTGETTPPGVEMKRWGESQGHKPGWVLWCWVFAGPAWGWGLGPGLRFHGDVRKTPMGWAGSTSRAQLAASTHPVRQGRPRCPEAPGALPCASQPRRAGRAVLLAMADGGRQLHSVTFLADPVISISRQVLKSSWKPVRRQLLQQLPRGILGLSTQLALVRRSGGGWLVQSATCCWSLFLEGISLLLGSSDAHARSLPWRCNRAQSISVHQSQRAPCRKHKKKPYSIAINSACSQSYL